MSNTDIAHIIATLEVFDSGAGLPILIVGGLYLEDQVSRCCLQALAHGYDTHLLCDAIFPLEKEMVQNHLSRLTQAGAVPSSLNQITSFLIADESDAQVVAELQLHIRIDK